MRKYSRKAAHKKKRCTVQSRPFAPERGFLQIAALISHHCDMFLRTNLWNRQKTNEKNPQKNSICALWLADDLSRVYCTGFLSQRLYSISFSPWALRPQLALWGCYSSSRLGFAVVWQQDYFLHCSYCISLWASQCPPLNVSRVEGKRKQKREKQIEKDRDNHWRQLFFCFLCLR